MQHYTDINGRRLASVKSHMRRILSKAQDRHCAYCGLPMRRHETRPLWRGTVDHAVPLSRGGYDGIGNLLAMHADCNARKGNDMPNGCVCIWLFAVNARLGVTPVSF